MKNICTVLVNSCDAYEDTWLPFFKILKEEWPHRPYPIVLNTESKNFDYEDMNIKTFNLYKKDKKVPWGKRLIETLKLIDTKYIIFMLDDFFLLDKVEQTRIEECIEWLENDDNIAVFSFWRTRGNNIKSDKYKFFEKRPQDGEYRFNCQAAVWRRERLIEFIRPHESPWDWELLGSIRSRRYKDEFYSAIEGEPYIFKYDFFNGAGIHRGLWVKNGVVDLFKKYSIDIDFSIRGFESDNVKRPEDVGLKLIIRKMKSLRYRINYKFIAWKSLK